VVDGLVDRHLRHEDLLVATGDLQIALAVKRLQEKPVPRVLGALEQAVDRAVGLRDVEVDHGP
jgi:hypothetical protein